MIRRIGLAGGLALFIVCLLLAPPAGMTLPAWRAAAVGILMAIWWISEAIPIPATALIPLVLFPVLDVVPIRDAAAPYANPVIFLFLGGFLIAGALRRCGLHERMALSIVALVGTRPAAIVAGFMAATAFLSMWVSNTATVVMMFPMALSVIVLAESTDHGPGPGFEGALLLGLAYAANIGGMATLIGTPPNAVLAGFLSETTGREIGFVQWMGLGLPVVLIALPVAWWYLVRIQHRLPTAPIAGGGPIFKERLAAKPPPSRAEWTVGIVTALTALAWIIRPLLETRLPGLSDAGIAIGGALLMFVIPVERRSFAPALTWEEAEKLPWSVLILFGGGLSLAGAVERTGLAGWIGGAMEPLQSLPIIVVTAAITATVILLTELTSNTATAAAFLPVVGAIAVGMGKDPLLLALPTALAASCAFMLPVATPPNAIVFGSGRLTIPQMARAGIWMNLLMLVVILAAVFLIGVPLFRLR
ncbi:MAG: SLC13 family permease [Gemmatimonadales bacterium]